MFRKSFVIFIFIGLFSCRVNPEAKAVEQAVRSYNTALMQAYRDSNINYLMPFASENELNKLFPQFLALETTNSRMIAIQDKFSIKGINVGKTTATLKAEEHWTYWWEDKNTGVITRPKKEQDYKIIYTLKKAKGEWIVDSLSPF
jgi:hypothetical protein